MNALWTMVVALAVGIGIGWQWCQRSRRRYEQETHRILDRLLRIGRPMTTRDLSVEARVPAGRAHVILTRLARDGWVAWQDESAPPVPPRRLWRPVDRCHCYRRVP